MRISTSDTSVDIYPGYPETPDASTGALVVAGGRTVAPSRTPGRAPEMGRESSDVSTGVKPDANRQRNQDTVELQKLGQRDIEVRQHEQMRLATRGSYTRSGPLYDYRLGPDGRLYAVGGGVTLDVSPVPESPPSTMTKMEQIRRAVLTPGQLSARDYSAASRASYEIFRTRMEMMRQQRQNAQERPTVMVQPKGAIIDTWV